MYFLVFIVWAWNFLLFWTAWKSYSSLPPCAVEDRDT